MCDNDADDPTIHVVAAATGAVREISHEERNAHTGSSVSIADLSAAGPLRPGQELRFRGRDGTPGRLTLDGTIIVNGRTYGSPSTTANVDGGHLDRVEDAG